MDSAPSTENVLQALNALYHSPDCTAKEKASSWLADLQTSVFAWSISDQLLAIARDVESCYFAAQTMRTKIQHHFYELPPSSHQSLRDSLLNHICKCDSSTNQTVITQLCLALADLALQMAAWKNAVLDLLQQFGADARMSGVLMDILTVIPEEVSSRALRLGANRREELTLQLRQSFPLVHEFLLAFAASTQHDTKKLAKVFKCMESWFYANAIQQDAIVGSSLLVAIFHVLSGKDCPPQLHEAAADCLCSALRIAEDLNNYQALAGLLLNGTLQLQPAYMVAVAEEDVDKCLNYCRIFTDMAESFLEAIVAEPGQGLGDLRQLNLVLACVEHEHYEVAEVTFNFWYRLSDVLYEKNDMACSMHFVPYVQRLIMVLCRHSQLEADLDGVLQSTDDFYDFRMRTAELIKDVVYIVGSSNCFTEIFEAIKATHNNRWHVTESLLFVMTAVAKNITSSENLVVPQVLQAVLSIPDSSPLALRHTSVQFIGELSEWIESHTQFIDAALQYLLTSLHCEKLAAVSAAAIENICNQCNDHLAPHFGLLLQVVEAASEKLKLPGDAVIRLLKGAAVVLSKMPHADITTGLRKLCWLQIEPLKKLTSTSESSQSSKAAKQEAGALLDRLAAILRHAAPTMPSAATTAAVSQQGSRLHPCFPVVEELWPFLSAACDAYQADIKTIEKCCRCIRFAIRCLGLSFTPLLSGLVGQLVTLYAAHLHSCYLYLGSILVDVYGVEKGCIEGLLAMTSALAEPTFRLLSAASVSGNLQEHPDTIDDFFRLVLRFVQRAPLRLLQAPLARPLFQCALTACKLNHKEANASVTRFLCELLKCGHEREELADFGVRRATVLELVQADGRALIQSVVDCVVGALLPAHMLDDIGDVVYQLLILDRKAVSAWLEDCLKGVPSMTSGGVVTVTQQQMLHFHNALSRAESGQSVTASLEEFMKLYK